MFILGAGAAYPKGELTDEFLASLGLSLSAGEREILGRFGVSSRRTVLPLDYIKATKNPDVLEARKVSTSSPTGLAVVAAGQAMERAGIAAEQLGLIIADCATPYQTCPSEAQRLGGALKLKVPAYDVTGGIGSLALALDMLSSWKPARIPEYVLCVSTNTPTELLRYEGAALPAYLFGDAASAVVLSASRAGKLRVKGSYLVRERGVRPPIEVIRDVRLSIDRLMPEPLLKDRISAGLLSLGATKSAYVVGPQLFAGDTRSIASTLSLPGDRVVSASSSHGYALGSSAGCGLASLWGSMKAGDEVAILHEGDGISGGILAEALA